MRSPKELQVQSASSRAHDGILRFRLRKLINPDPRIKRMDPGLGCQTYRLIALDCSCSQVLKLGPPQLMPRRLTGHGHRFKFSESKFTSLIPQHLRKNQSDPKFARSCSSSLKFLKYQCWCRRVLEVIKPYSKAKGARPN